jgi:hypothetical protein
MQLGIEINRFGNDLDVLVGLVDEPILDEASGISELVLDEML